MLIGYARCSTIGQDLRVQQTRLRALGVDDARIFTDHGHTGANRERPGLRAALAAVRPGDVLVVPALDRLGRSVRDLTEISRELTKRDVSLSINGAIYDPTDPTGKIFFVLLAAFAEFEHDVLRSRARDGIAAARAAGKYRGRVPKLNATQRAYLLKMWSEGTHSAAEIAAILNVGRSTVYRELTRAGAGSVAGEDDATEAGAA